MIEHQLQTPISLLYFLCLLLLSSCQSNHKAIIDQQNQLLNKYSLLSIYDKDFNSKTAIDEVKSHIQYLEENTPKKNRHYYLLMKARVHYIEGNIKACLEVLKQCESGDPLLYHMYSGIIYETLYDETAYELHYKNAQNLCQQSNKDRALLCRFIDYLNDDNKNAYLDYVRNNYDTDFYNIVEMLFERYDDPEKSKREMILGHFLNNCHLPEY